ncbi:Histidine kinase [Pseudoxanthomonas sp. CF125]|nr:Histidine kinase [Pseudoxanthomonas sp. CF125]
MLSTSLRGLALLFAWRRLVFAILVALSLSLLLLFVWRADAPTLFVRVMGSALAAVMIFGLFEQWPRRLPAWLARWALQVLGVALVVPTTLFLFYFLSTETGQPAFWMERERLGGFAVLALTGLLVAPWVALAALVRQKDAIARHQALAFELERSELSRRALDARLRLLQAQVEPHFLFNTLANVRALVVAGSPMASQVLESLIAYLRAAVPRLQNSATTILDEVALVQAYLELMHIRMPDRLQYGIVADPESLGLTCPPTTILTLVENAVRHGIDPSEEGGRIDVSITTFDERCVVEVRDTGVGFHESYDGCGTGLASLRERLHLVFAGEASLHISADPLQGVLARIEIPIRKDLP